MNALIFIGSSTEPNGQSELYVRAVIVGRSEHPLKLYLLCSGKEGRRRRKETGHYSYAAASS